MSDISYYYCQHCREKIALEFTCPCCSLGKPESYPATSRQNLFDEFFSWLTVHRLGREQLFVKMREKYDWGYINACTAIESELRRLLQEHKDDSDRVEGDKGLLGEEIS